MTEVDSPEIDLTDPTLFGNDAAEDEPDDVFNSYAFERPEVAIFSDAKRSLCIARAYKGEGKSAMLRLAQRKVRNLRDVAERQIIISRTASELSPEVSNDNYATWTRAWKAAIFGIFAAEIGATIGIAWSDDAMALVEESEKTGFKQRNLVSAILDRLTPPKIEIGGAAISLPGKKASEHNATPESVRRFVSNRISLWLFVDDVDKNFQNIPAERARIGSFFDACRELTNTVPELRIRSAIRPNVWSILRLEFESLSHVEQYASDLTWSESDAKTLLERRVEGYLKRYGKWAKVSRRLAAATDPGATSITGLVFEASMHWGQGYRPPHAVLYTLSKRRPRWMIELSKVAASCAVRLGHRVITLEDITSELEKFGLRRIQDTVAEFRSQCPQIEEVVLAFTREREQLSTADLMRVIDNKILSHLSPTISGVSGRPTNLQLAALLFEIGLIYGRRDYANGNYEHIAFSDRPGLLRTRTNVDAGLSWEVHPVYRQALEMRDSAGFELDRPQGRR
jgi:hypothetical protein